LRGMRSTSLEPRPSFALRSNEWYNPLRDRDCRVAGWEYRYIRAWGPLP
jgi:hypothetical protein